MKRNTSAFPFAWLLVGPLGLLLVLAVNRWVTVPSFLLGLVCGVAGVMAVAYLIGMRYYFERRKRERDARTLDGLTPLADDERDGR